MTEEPQHGRVIPEMRQLKHVLTADENADLGQQLSRAIRGQQETLDEKAEVMAEFSQRVKAGTARINELANALNQGYHMREVYCQRIIDFTAGKVRIKRIDTGDIVEEREMRDDERQMVLEVGRATATETIEKALDAQPLRACVMCGKTDVEVFSTPLRDGLCCLDCLAALQKEAGEPKTQCTAEMPCCEQRDVKPKVGEPDIDCGCTCHDDAGEPTAAEPPPESAQS